ncbi:hypothetical protein BCR39DRAFT_543574 [Naematelia encephala]|uniref:YABBY protein C-terminal domain-containing protein n=1 Tax=Naematelia encephala TaxID=71784 RepID=A0A1Y2ATT8_9TREE|nr:hypothetical protein BCR39DRAFT_543574 [Naematelia encephala]
MPPKKTSTPKKKTASKKGSGTPSAYNVYMKKKLEQLKKDEPDLLHKDKFKKAAASWATAPENPKNKKK